MGSIYKRGRVYWIAWFDARGKRHSESSRIRGRRGTGRDFNAAKRQLAEREADASRGLPVIKDAAKFTFDDAAALVKDNYVRKERRSLPDMERRLEKHLTPYFGGTLLSLVTTDMIDGFVATRKKANASNGEINRELAIIKRAFTLAARAGKIHARPHVEMLAEAKPREGFFEHQAFDAVCKQLPKEIAPLARFCYITGWRWKSEVRPLTWSQVDTAHGTVSIPTGRTKGGEPRVFIITPELRRLLKKQRTYTAAVEGRTGRTCALVFHREGEPLTSLYDAWRAACKAAEVPGRLLHDLRRTAIRNLIRAGVSETVAMRMSGHKTRSVFDRYNVTAEKDLRQAAALLSAHHKALDRAATATFLLQSGRKRPGRPRTKR